MTLELSNLIRLNCSVSSCQASEKYFSVPFISIERARFTELGAGARCEGRLFGGSNPVAQQLSDFAEGRPLRGCGESRAPGGSTLTNDATPFSRKEHSRTKTPRPAAS
jgi:hypothetical protein